MTIWRSSGVRTRLRGRGDTSPAAGMVPELRKAASDTAHAPLVATSLGPHPPWRVVLQSLLACAPAVHSTGCECSLQLTALRCVKLVSRGTSAANGKQSHT